MLARVYDISVLAALRRAASSLRALLAEPDWLIDIKAQMDEQDEPVVVVRVRYQAPHVNASIPYRVDDIKVVVT